MNHLPVSTDFVVKPIDRKNGITTYMLFAPDEDGHFQPSLHTTRRYIAYGDVHVRRKGRMTIQKVYNPKLLARFEMWWRHFVILHDKNGNGQLDKGDFQ